MERDAAAAAAEDARIARLLELGAQKQVELYTKRIGLVILLLFIVWFSVVQPALKLLFF